MTDSLSEVFGCIKKGSKNIFFYLRKLSRLRGKFSSTALVINTFYVNYWSVLKSVYY